MKVDDHLEVTDSRLYWDDEVIGMVLGHDVVELFSYDSMMVIGTSPATRQAAAAAADAIEKWCRDRRHGVVRVF